MDDKAQGKFHAKASRAAHTRAKRKRRAEKLKNRLESLRVKRLLSQLSNKEIDESFERAIEK